MKRTLAVLLRAPLSMAAILVAGALIGAVPAVPSAGLAKAFAPSSLLASMADTLPWAVSLTAWYLSVVSASRLRSRLASHALVFSICAACMAIGVILVTDVDRPATAFAPPDPVPRRFTHHGETIISAESWKDQIAHGLIVVDDSKSPRIAWFRESAWSPEEGLVYAEGSAHRATPEATRSEVRVAPPLIRASGAPSDWIPRANDPMGILILALSFAALASGVRFPVRMFAWPMPGAMLGLLYAWAVPGIFGMFGSASIKDALGLAGINLSPASYSAILAAASGLLLLGADLVFRPADELPEPHDA